MTKCFRGKLDNVTYMLTQIKGRGVATSIFAVCLMLAGDAFNPAELLLASVAACMIKGIERVVPILKFEFRGVAVKLHGVLVDEQCRK